MAASSLDMDGLSPLEMAGRLHASLVDRVQTYLDEMDAQMAAKDREIDGVSVRCGRGAHCSSYTILSSS